MSKVLEHIKSRHCDPSRYHVSIDDDEGVACFLLFNLTGRIVGYQNYRPGAPKVQNNDPKESRYYTFTTSPTGSKNKEIAVFGLETINYHKNLLFLTEGIFDAVRLHNLGLPAVAVLSNDPKQLRPWLRALGRYVVCVCDGDKAGRKLAKLGNEAVILYEGHDLGDMTDADVEKTVEKWL